MIFVSCEAKIKQRVKNFRNERIKIMSKTLSNILTVFKIARILAKIVFICCIIGAVCCSIALLVLPMAEAVVPDVFTETGIDISAVYAAITVGIIACVGEAVFAFWAERYFKSVLDAETPFTFDGAKECFRLGIASLIISVATSIVSGIAAGIVTVLSKTNAAELDYSTSISLSVGLFFMFISMLFKYGAEQQKLSAEEETKDEQSSQL